MGLRRGRISRADADTFLASLRSLNIQHTDPISYDAVFRLAEANRLTVYDAAYLDLAIREGAQIASRDDNLLKAAAGHGLNQYDPRHGN